MGSVTYASSPAFRNFVWHPLIYDSPVEDAVVQDDVSSYRNEFESPPFEKRKEAQHWGFVGFLLRRNPIKKNNSVRRIDIHMFYLLGDMRVLKDLRLEYCLSRC